MGEAQNRPACLIQCVVQPQALFPSGFPRPRMALFCKFRSLTSIVFLRVLVTVGFPVRAGSLQCRPQSSETNTSGSTTAGTGTCPAPLALFIKQTQLSERVS